MKKIRDSFRKRSLLILSLMVGLILGGTVEVRAEQKPGLAILPILVERTEDPSRGAVCPVCQGISRKGPVAPGAQNILTRLLYQKMEPLETFRVIPFERVEETLSELGAGRLESKPVPSAIQVGKNLGADFVFVGYLFRFEERIGSALGAEKPASVGYHIHLFRIRDGKEVWMGKFDETQQPLTENLLQLGSFLRRKANWLTAQELAAVGMDELLAKFPGLKELEEQQGISR